MKETKDDIKIERYSMFLGREIQCDPYQITNDIFHKARTKNFTIHMETHQ